jgi:hypothetical protein
MKEVKTRISEKGMRINEMWNCGFICYLAVTKSDWLPSNEKT